MTTKARSLEDYAEMLRRVMLDASDKGKTPKVELTDDELAVCFYDGVGSHVVAFYLLTGLWAEGREPVEWVILDGGDNEVARVHACTDYGALQAYSLGEDFAPYGPESELGGYDPTDEGLICPSRHPLSGRLWAPFTNFEITAERAR